MKYSQCSWSRRSFVTAMAGTGAAIALSPLISWAYDETDPHVAAIVAATIGVDSHNHVDVPLLTAEVPGPNIDLAGEMEKSGLSAICMTFALDYQKLTEPGQAYERFLNALTCYDQQLKNNGMKRTLDLADLKNAHKYHQPTVIQSVEGSHFLEGKLERLEEAYKRGLRHLCLLHDSDASTPLGDVFTNLPKFNGLTEFGTQVVKECNRLGVLVDMSHGTNETVDAAIKVSTKPILVSHTGLDFQLGQNLNMARMMKPRLISKEQAKVVADSGGVVGVWTHLSDTPLEYAQNIRALVDVIGVGHVCIGTDTKLTPSYRSPNSGGPEFKQQPPPPAGAPNGDRPGGPPNAGTNRPRIGERTNEAWADQKVGFYYTVVDALLKTGFNADEIAKIGGGNFCRIFGEATEKQY